ncbi:MAG: hypothetical protein EOO55_00650 [Hymenobacter sp.]|nr:MAG: hypothetical protein EOO55_00650 [Hymenobacter sp.]
MIKIYFVNRNIFSPFTDGFSKQYLLSKGLILTKNPFAADLFISLSEEAKSYKIFKSLFWFRKFIIWTNEPRFNYSESSYVDKNSVAMNVYTKNVFLHNLHFLGSYHCNFDVNLGIVLHQPPYVALTAEKLKKRKFCAAIFTYQKPEKSAFIVNKKNIDLYALRQNLAYFMYLAGKADIVGSNWPAEISVVESSGFESGNLLEKTEWWDVKIKLLRNYKFNICFENTSYPHYCTEKIWHAIASGCLPIYYGEGTLIYETFPENSFIDAAKFKSNESLLSFLEEMTPEEHIARYNLCLEVLTKSCAARLANPDLKTDVLAQFVGVVYQLVRKP